MDLQSFYKGTCFDAYTEQGCQYHDHQARFCTYAPNAQRVALIGEFSSWESRAVFYDLILQVTDQKYGKS